MTSRDTPHTPEPHESRREALEARRDTLRRLRDELRAAQWTPAEWRAYYAAMSDAELNAKIRAELAPYRDDAAALTDDELPAAIESLLRADDEARRECPRSSANDCGR